MRLRHHGIARRQDEQAHPAVDALTSETDIPGDGRDRFSGIVELPDFIEQSLAVCAANKAQPFAQKIAYSVIDMTINSLIRRRKRTMAEVSRPTAQKAIELRTNLRPCAFVARYQQVADFRLDPLHAFLGRRRAQIPTTTVGEVAWSERIAKEIEAFPPRADVAKYFAHMS